jgi:PilZ domain-containing protein
LFSADITVMTYHTVEGGGGVFEERRSAERFKLVLPVHLNNGTGTTRDISTSGISFETKVIHSVGDPIQLSVNFGDTMIVCEGRVVRLEKLDGKSVIAVELTSYDFQ